MLVAAKIAIAYYASLSCALKIRNVDVGCGGKLLWSAQIVGAGP